PAQPVPIGMTEAGNGVMNPYSQVSNAFPFRTRATVTRRSASYAMGPEAEGDVGVTFAVQLVPSHSQTSVYGVPALDCPPNNTVTPRAISKAMPGFARGDGVAMPKCCAHCCPSHSHVSLNETPPKRTTRSRAESYAIACPTRGTGPPFPTC